MMIKRISVNHVVISLDNKEWQDFKLIYNSSTENTFREEMERQRNINNACTRIKSSIIQHIKENRDL